MLNKFAELKYSNLCMLPTQITLLFLHKETLRDSSLCFQIAQLLKVMPKEMLNMSAIFNLTLPYTAWNNLYMMSRDVLLPSSLMRAPIDLLTNSMMDIFNIGQEVSIRSRTDILAPALSGIALVMISGLFQVICGGQ